MNKYAQALNQIPYRKKDDKAFEALQELVDRATPKKIIETAEEGYKVYRCPSCNEGVCPSDHYCFKCGQAIELEERE